MLYLRAKCPFLSRAQKQKRLSDQALFSFRSKRPAAASQSAICNLQFSMLSGRLRSGKQASSTKPGSRWRDTTLRSLANLPSTISLLQSSVPGTSTKNVPIENIGTSRGRQEFAPKAHPASLFEANIEAGWRLWRGTPRPCGHELLNPIEPFMRRTKCPIQIGLGISIYGHEVKITIFVAAWSQNGPTLVNGKR